MNQTVAAAKPIGGLSRLHEHPLAQAYRQILEQVAAGCGGPDFWRRRKIGAAHEVLALAEVSGRLEIQFLDLAAAFRTIVFLKVPVPCRRHHTDPLRIAPGALLGLTYRQEAATTIQSGFSFFEILQPRDVFHPNVSSSSPLPGLSPVPPGAAPQALCLGHVPAGIRALDLILLAYGALSLQTVQFSISDPAGLLNPEAALWFQANPSKIPLTREPFLFNKEAKA